MAHDVRATDIAKAASCLTAEHDVEGFRIRVLAPRVGIHHAPLPHDFPSKQAVIQAVASHLLQEWQVERVAQDTRTLLDALGYE
jgi:AcrR family transcriptional regulator